MAIVINAVDRMVGWPQPHVGQERREVVPTFTDRDAPSAVVLEMVVVFILASLNHPAPRLILGCHSSADKCPMSESIISLAADAPATLSMAGSEVARVNHARFAAVTATTNTSPDGRNARFINDEQASETLTEKSTECWHDPPPRGVRVESARQLGTETEGSGATLAATTVYGIMQ